MPHLFRCVPAPVLGAVLLTLTILLGPALAALAVLTSLRSEPYGTLRAQSPEGAARMPGNVRPGKKHLTQTHPTEIQPKIERNIP